MANVHIGIPNLFSHGNLEKMYEKLCFYFLVIAFQIFAFYLFANL